MTRTRKTGKEALRNDEPKNIFDFDGYTACLSRLEDAFNKGKVPVKFRLFMAALENPMVEVTYKNGKERDVVCITGDSPAGAVKTVAARVKL